MLSIGEFSKICRVSTKTLRHYDSVNLVKPKYINRDNGYRFYDISQFKDMVFIDKLKQYGFSLTEIAVLLYAKDDLMLAESIRQKKKDLQNKMSIDSFILKKMNQDILKLERRIDIMEGNYTVKLVETEAMNILSIRQMMGLKDFDVVTEKLIGKMYKNNYTPSGCMVAIYHDKEFNPSNSDIEVAIPVKEVNDETRTLEGSLCCMTSFVGPYIDFTPAYTALGAWIEQEGYEIIDPPYEKYVKGPADNISPDEYVTEIYFPIKKM